MSGVDASWFATLATTVATNGFETVGISDALDQGLTKAMYTAVPHKAASDVTLSNELALNDYKGVAGIPDGKHWVVANANTEKPKLVNVLWQPVVEGGRSRTKRVYYSHDTKKFYLDAASAPLTDKVVWEIVYENSTWIEPLCAKNGYNVQWRNMLYAIVLNQIILGLIDGDEDAEVSYSGGPVADDAKITQMKADKKMDDTFMEELKKLTPTAKLLMSAAVLNHYKINHTIGQGSVQGFVKKVSGIIEMFRIPPNLDDVGKKKYINDLADYLYIALHRVGKRNGAFALLEPSEWVQATFSYQARPTISFKKDDFVSLRAAGAPAGAAKIYVLSTGLKMMASSGLIVFAPELSKIPDLARMAARIKAAPILCHIGARWYTKFHPGAAALALDWNQNTETTTVLTKVVSVFLKHVAPRSTLAQSPNLRDAYESAKAELAAWDTVCQAYAAAKDKVVASDRINVLIAASTNAAALDDADKALTILADPTQSANHKAATDAFYAAAADVVKNL